MYELNHKEKGYLTANERELARIRLENRDMKVKNVPDTFSSRHLYEATIQNENRHQAPRQHPHRQPLDGLAHHFGETKIVLFLMKNRRPIVAAIDHMITYTSRIHSWFPCHNDSIIGIPLPACKPKSSLTPYSPVPTAFHEEAIFNVISLWQVDTLGTPKSSDHPWIRSH